MGSRKFRPYDRGIGIQFSIASTRTSFVNVAQNTANARIDLAAVRHNLAMVRALCPRSRTMAMIKADAYGHGLLPVARALNAADGFAVARLQEALALREAGIEQRILLLATLLDHADLATCSQQSIDVTAHDKASVDSIDAVACKMPLRVWLKLDSGMHRVGLDPAAFIEADRTLSSRPGVLELTHMTHFSSADDMATGVMDQQLACFSACHSANPKAKVSLANSAALITRPDTHADWVRPGIMLYGSNPVRASHDVRLRAAMTLHARVIAIRDIGAGESVGYNSRWTSARPSRIATIGIGYGDGYPRQVGNGTPVLLDGCMAPLVGRVSMDSLTVDVTDCERVAVGDEATLWGPELPVATIAEHARTISYELLTSLRPRVTREYANQS
jgi:alanine racemase